MTTLVALPTKDAVVMGCDSLATVAQPMVDPRLFFQEFFDGKSGKLRRDAEGRPALQSVEQVLNLTEMVPFDHMTDVDKLFSLKPLAMGVMFTGITSIGDRTIKSLLGEFREKDKAFHKGASNYTVKSIAKRLLDHLLEYYKSQYGELPSSFYPPLELILAGYDKSGPHPGVVKIDLKKEEIQPQERFWPVFGGQSREIERIVYGLDGDSFVRIEERHRELLMRYAAKLAVAIEQDVSTLPKPGKEFRIFTDDMRIPGLAAKWGNFSEQNAIDCVAYFVRIMCDAQRFSARMPTVGGAIHIGLVDREDGFRFISRREYSHEDHRVQRN